MLKKVFIIFMALLCICSTGCTKFGKNKKGDDINPSTPVPKMGGVANIACFTPDTLNPLITKYANVNDVLMLVYEGLFTANEDLSVNPVLAESFTVSTSNKIYTIKLKSGIKFHDGTDFDAEDVIATLNYLKSYNTTYNHCISQILSYEAKDSRSVSLELINPQPDFMAVMDFPVLPSGLTSVSFADESQAFIPNGTGKFKYDSSKQMRGITLKRNADYYDSPAYINQINVQYLDDSESIYNSFNSGELDMITTSDLVWGEFSFSADIKSFETGSGNYTFIGVNHKNPFLSDRETRKAILNAINKKELTEAVVFKHGITADTPVIGTSHYAGNLIDDVKDDGQINTRYEQTLYVLFNEESDEKRRIAGFLQKSLDKIGIKLVFSETDFNTYLEKIKNDDYELYIGEVNMANNMNMDFMFDEVLKTDQNLCNFESDEFTSLITNYNLSTKDAESTKINYSNLVNYFNGYVPQIPLYHKTRALYVNSKIKGNIKPNMSNYYGDVGDFYIKYN